jgi:hypothetical protein
MQEEEGEQRPEPLPVQGYRSAVLDDSKRAENAEVNGDSQFVPLVTRREQARRLEPG